MARGPLAGAAGPGKFSKRTDGMSFALKFIDTAKLNVFLRFHF